MRHMLHTLGILVITTILGFSATDAVARSSFLSAFTNEYGNSGSRLDECGLCHYDFRGGGRTNGYSSDWVAAGGLSNASAAFLQIENTDSDGDGVTNLAEILDLFYPGYDCDNYGQTQNAPSNLADYVNPNNIGCGTAQGPQIEVSPLSLGFGSVDVGSSANQIVRVRNVGDAQLNVLSAVLSGSPQFSASGPSTPVGIAPGGEEQWTITYEPSAEGSAAASFMVTSDDPSAPSISVDATGQGIVPGPVVLDLDIVGMSVSKRVRLERNPSVKIVVAIKNMSSIGGETRPATLQAMQNGQVVYTETQEVFDDVGGGRERFAFGPYTATNAGNLEWTLQIDDDDEDVDVETATTLVISSNKMTGADLTGADLRGEVLVGVDLAQADLRGADFRGADLSDATGLAQTLSDALTLYDSSTNFTGTGFDPEAAGWTQSDKAAIESGTFGRVKALFDGK